MDYAILESGGYSESIFCAMMQKIYIDKLLHNKNFIREFLFEPNDMLELDFTNVREIRLNDIQRLLDLQKLAIYNEISLRINNLEPNISKILKQTGLYKTFNTIGATSVKPINKRLALE